VLGHRTERGQQDFWGEFSKGISLSLCPAWVGYGQGTRRDLVVGNVFDYDRTLVDVADPVAVLKLHQEEHNRRRSREIEDERRH
jgi:hypothetical protein